MKPINLVIMLFLLSLSGTLQSQYVFKDEIKLPATPVKNQQATGTCWSFATTSFLESEIIRKTGEYIDLSEMYNARMAYSDKAMNYVLRQGEATFSQGGLSEDVLRNVDLHGMMPQAAYPGLVGEDTVYRDHELTTGMKGFLDAVIKARHPSTHWQNALEGMLDAYLGPVPESFMYNGKSYTARTFADMTGIEGKDYSSFTSYTHHPFHHSFILEIPDNYMNNSYFNLKLDELVEIIDQGLQEGYSILWDGDVGEKGFSQKEGIAVLPLDPKADSIFKAPVKEVDATQERRQEEFMSYETTEDHLMHLVGRAKDQDGTVYYIIKNSWGEKGEYEGYLYMSLDYLKMKTVSITIATEAVPRSIQKLF